MIARARVVLHLLSLQRRTAAACALCAVCARRLAGPRGAAGRKLRAAVRQWGPQPHCSRPAPCSREPRLHWRARLLTRDTELHRFAGPRRVSHGGALLSYNNRRHEATSAYRKPRSATGVRSAEGSHGDSIVRAHQRGPQRAPFWRIQLQLWNSLSAPSQPPRRTPARHESVFACLHYALCACAEQCCASRATAQVAVEGCCHGELDKIYTSMQRLEKKEGIKIDLLICCGDFQARWPLAGTLAPRSSAISALRTRVTSVWRTACVWSQG